MPSYPGFLGPAYQSASYVADAEVLRNWYLEKNESPGAPQPFAMFPTPGFSTFASVSQAPIRGEFYQNGRAFFVAGFAFYELFSDGTTTQRGTVTADTNPVTINANGDAGEQLWITSGGVGYVYDLNTNTLTISGVPGTTVTMGGFLSGRFLYLDADSGAFYASALYDGSTWDASMVAQSESGDPWRALIVTPDDLIRLIGETTGEAWANQGTSPFPFSKVQEASIPFGIAASFAWTVDTAINWLAQSKQGRGIVVRAPGYGPDRISTHAIEHFIQGYSDISDATAFCYQENGHAFTTFTFPTPDQSWTFDSSIGLWHQRDYWNTLTATSMAYRPGCSMDAFGKLLVGDRLTGTIYEMSSAFYSDVDGAAIRRMRQPPRFSVDQKRVTIENLQLVMDVGQGLVTGQGTDPQVMLRCSHDGGQTFGNERMASAGAMGRWGTRVRWNQCGQARNFVPQFTATDPVPWRITDCLMTARVGRN